MNLKAIPFFLSIILFTYSCTEDADPQIGDPIGDDPIISAVEQTFGDKIDLTNLYNYESQTIPNYINRDNTQGNTITNEIATLGRVLFYDKKLSVNNTISCASCHLQEFAFGDPGALSVGVNGETGRHAMRLVNSRFSQEVRFFWDERANSLEEQTTMPIQDHIEMGFSGQNGDPGIDDLIDKISAETYYQELFTLAFGNPLISEERMQDAMAQLPADYRQVLILHEKMSKNLY